MVKADTDTDTKLLISSYVTVGLVGLGIGVGTLADYLFSPRIKSAEVVNINDDGIPDLKMKKPLGRESFYLGTEDGKFVSLEDLYKTEMDNYKDGQKELRKSQKRELKGFRHDL